MKDVFGNDIKFAPTNKTDLLNNYIDRILWAIAPIMEWEDLSHVFVSDLSEV